MGVIVAVVVLPVAWVWIAGTFEFLGTAWLARDVEDALTEAITGDPGTVAARHRAHVRIWDADRPVADVDRSARGGWFSPMSDPFYGPEGPPDLAEHDRSLPPVLERPEVRAAPTVICGIVERGLLLVCSGASITSDGRLVHVVEGSPRLLRSLYEQRFQLTAMTLVMVGIGTVLALLLGWRMVGPLEQLRDQVVDRTRDRLSTEPVVMDRDDEIGQLAAAFNELLSALDDRNRANTTFAADLAHELKNPVAAIQAATEALSADRPLDGERLERLRRVLGDAGRRMEVVVHQFLELARAEAGLAGAVREDFDLTELVTHLADTARTDARNHRLTIDVAGVPAPVHAVPERLETAVRNLLANACFHAVGRVGLAVVVDGDVVLTVTDDGPGIAESELPALFTRYHTARAGGTGLGLSMTRAIVEAHGGRISAESVVGRGATFRIQLPARVLH